MRNQHQPCRHHQLRAQRWSTKRNLPENILENAPSIHASKVEDHVDVYISERRPMQARKSTF